MRIADRVEPTRIRAVTANLFTCSASRRRSDARFPRAANASGTARPFSVTGSGRNGSRGRQDAIGATIWINNQPHTVIGVMPRRFWFSETERSGVDAARTRSAWMRRHGSAGRRAASRQARAPMRWRRRLQGSLAEYSRQLPAGRGPLKMRVSEIKGRPSPIRCRCSCPTSSAPPSC